MAIPPYPGYKTTVTEIPLSQIKEIYGAMSNGIEIFLKDGSSYTTLYFTIDTNCITGTFVRSN